MVEIGIKNVQFKGINTALVIEARNPETNQALTYMFPGHRKSTPLEEVVKKAEELKAELL